MWQSSTSEKASFSYIIQEINKEKEFKIKIDKVGRLMDTAMFLGMFDDRLFDNLMDKYEKTPDLFNFMYDCITSLIFRKAGNDIVMIKFQELLSMRHIGQIRAFTYF